MSITSFWFFCFLALGVLLFYLTPGRVQWVTLLLLSLAFYALAASPLTFVYVLLTALPAWALSLAFERCREAGGEPSQDRRLRLWLTLVLVFDVALWFLCKGGALLDFFLFRLPGRLIPALAGYSAPRLAAALGMGYFLLQIMGYTIDCWRGNVRAEKSALKLLLFTCFFPQMVTGPISRFEQLAPLYAPHRPQYRNLAHGCQRILWGLFKKLVLAERCAAVVNSIWSMPGDYQGFYVWVALLLFPLQVYTDFSGCMDIVIGSAELFDIPLTENFNVPFYSRTVQELWQKWHITLGTWAKDYVLYPVLKSAWMQRLGKTLRKKYGKKNGKMLASALGMLPVWLVIGVWHGEVKHIVGVSLWFWFFLILGEWLKPWAAAFTARHGFRTESFGWHLFQSLRTYLIFALGISFFQASSVRDGLRFLRSLLGVFRPFVWNPWILFDGSLGYLGAYFPEINLMLVGFALLAAAGTLREKYGSARAWLDRQSVPLRWAVYLFLFFTVLIAGKYGPGYEVGAFLYGNF